MEKLTDDVCRNGRFVLFHQRPFLGQDAGILNYDIKPFESLGSRCKVDYRPVISQVKLPDFDHVIFLLLGRQDRLFSLLAFLEIADR